jgi:glycine dehydrogenase subunit 1
MSDPAGRAVYPYIPNSVPDIRASMLAEVGAASTDELYDVVPEALRLGRDLALPGHGQLSEYDLRRHVEGLLSRNVPTSEVLSFLGGGTWPHFVPAVCDEVASRSEFITAYHDGERSMLGSYQAQFEFQSMMGELTGMQLVSTTTYDWGTAAASSLIMAMQITGRRRVLIPASIAPTRLREIRTIVGPTAEIVQIGYHPETGAMDQAALRDAASDGTAAVYLEVPAFLGFLEPNPAAIGEIAHSAGALFVVGVDPSSLGILAAPRAYGADIVCGDIQPLGIHMTGGGGNAGFIATPHEERYLATVPTLMVSIVPTVHDGEYVFEWANFESISYGLRAESHDFAGTAQTIWAIVAGAYLALMGPAGMRELGETIMARGAYARARLAELPGVSIGLHGATSFKEFVVRFEGGQPIAEINAALRERGIYGGLDLSSDFPELGNAALYCVTEIHRQEDIDRLVEVLGEIVR